MTDGNEIERVVISRQAERSMKSLVIEGAHGDAAEVEAHRLRNKIQLQPETLDAATLVHRATATVRPLVDQQNHELP